MSPSNASRRERPLAEAEDTDAVMYTKAEELRSFLFLTIVVAPALTFLLVAGYGFLVWMIQLVHGPPTGG
jgi:periplasmic nitrate reductase NapE